MTPSWAASTETFRIREAIAINVPVWQRLPAKSLTAPIFATKAVRCCASFKGATRV